MFKLKSISKNHSQILRPNPIDQQQIVKLKSFQTLSPIKGSADGGGADRFAAFNHSYKSL